ISTLHSSGIVRENAALPAPVPNWLAASENSFLWKVHHVDTACADCHCPVAGAPWRTHGTRSLAPYRITAGDGRLRSMGMAALIADFCLVACCTLGCCIHVRIHALAGLDMDAFHGSGAGR